MNGSHSPPQTDRGEPDSATPAPIWLAFWECLATSHRRWKTEIAQAAAEQRLSLEEALTISFLGHGQANGASQRQLASLVQVSPAKMSGLLETLRQRELLKPVRDTSDRRRQLWELTPDGQQLHQQLNLSITEAVLDAQAALELIQSLRQFHQAKTGPLPDGAQQTNASLRPRGRAA
jgi:DNA-binding MarR family transcriptional regulator